jgi:tripartite-type tricarboxylate transporter receptor subunit TctC
MTISRRTALAAGLAAALPAAPLAAYAQADWPNKPIRFLVGFSAGGPTDGFARLLARKLGDQLGQQVIVENRVGANANVAAELVARAPADGYTFLYNSSSLAISAGLYKNLRYDARKDLTPVSLLMALPIVFVAHPSIPGSTPAELFAHIKANPGKLNYASGGTGNAQHLGMAMILQHYGLEANHIPYKGSAPAHIDLLAGRVQLMIDASSSLLPYIRDKRLKPFAVLSPQRQAELAQVPTLAESGFPSFELEGWYGVMAPARTPAPIVRRLADEIAKAMASDDLKTSLAAQGGRSIVAPADRFDAYLQSEIGRYGKVINDLNIVAE